MPGATTDDLLSGVVRLLLDTTDTANAPIFPQGTITASVDPDADTIPYTLTAGSPAIPGRALLHFDDDAADGQGRPERRILLKQNTGTVLTVDTDRLGDGGGIRATHASGTRIYTNLAKGYNPMVGRYLTGTTPYVYVRPRRRVSENVTVGMEGHPRPYKVHHALYIVVLFRLTPPDGDQIDEELWAEELQDRSRPVVDAIEDRIKLFPGLNGLAGRWDDPVTEVDWDTLPDLYDVDPFGAAITYNPWVSTNS